MKALAFRLAWSHRLSHKSTPRSTPQKGRGCGRGLLGGAWGVPRPSVRGYVTVWRSTDGLAAAAHDHVRISVIVNTQNARW